MSDHGTSEAVPTQEAKGSESVSYALLDQALWQKFRNASGPDEFVETWLAILCRQIPGATAGMAMLGEPDVGPFTPLAYWPEKSLVAESLAVVSQKALAERQGVVMNAGVADSERTAMQMACPLTLDERLYGVCAVSFVAQNPSVNEIMRKVQWASGWVEVLLRRQMQDEDQEFRDRSRLAFDMLATVLENKGILAASTALVTDLAMRLDCDPVSIGFVRRRRCRVAAVSHAAGFGNKMNLIRDISAAMDEAVDQRAIVLYPVNEDWEYRVARAHEELARASNTPSVLTIPLQANHDIVGAITLQRPPHLSFDEVTVDLCDAVAAVVGPALEEKRRNDRNIFIKNLEAAVTQLKRLFGPNYFGRKLATAVFAALVAYFSLATAQYTVTSPAIIRGTIQRTIVAPFRGYVASEFARPGETVKIGQTLAQLDDQELIFERLRLSTTRRQKLAEYDRALSKHDRAEALIITTQIEQAEAQLALIDEQVGRTRIVAPFDGYVIDGDLSQSIGAAVERGQELFKIAPLDSYRVILEVDESDIDELEIGQTGVLRVASLPQEQMTYRVEQITAISNQKEGRNFFVVEAALEGASGRLRPGMEGVAKTAIEERLQILSYTNKLINWARLTAWRWMR